MEKRYDLAFYGETLPGFPSVQAKQVLLNLLNANRHAESVLFSGQRVLIRRALSQEKAEYYQRHFERFGFRMKLERAGSSDAAPPSIHTLLPDESVSPGEATRMLSRAELEAHWAAIQRLKTPTVVPAQQAEPAKTPQKRWYAIWAAFWTKLSERPHRHSSALH